MTARLFKIFGVLAITGMVTGCKLAVIVPSGGDVTSASGTKNCTGGSLCEHNITAANFNETFTAVARPGYVFTKWSAGPGFRCPNSTNPTCVISNVGAAGNPAVEAVIATGQHFYAMPLFDFVGIDTDADGIKDHVDTDDDNDGILDSDDDCPLFAVAPCAQIPLTVVMNGMWWAQVDLFTNLTWNQINAVCPYGYGRCQGVLNGYDMTGWVWADSNAVTALFNSLGVSPPLNPVDIYVDGYASSYPTRGDAIFSHGMRPMTDYPNRSVTGVTSSPRWGNPSNDHFIAFSWNESSYVQAFHHHGADTTYSDRGAWFYRAQ